MKICPNPACKTENPNQAKFCLNCGVGFEARPIYAANPDARYCIDCGRPLRHFHSDRRLVTVLFADVHGFTAMSELLQDPELVTEVMNRCFGMLTTKIVEMGGSIDKYVGDAVMAVFGAPDAHEDDPERAVRAALAMQKELIRFNTLMLQERGLSLGLEMRIGLNTGLVTAGDVGGLVEFTVSDELGQSHTSYRDYRAYTVMGPTVNLASRLESASRVGYILVSDSTYNATRHAFEFVQQPPRKVKGITEPVTTWEVAGPKAQRETRRGLAGYDLQLIGRETELATLWEALDTTLHNTGQIISIIGEAGAGKTSLLREFRRRLQAAYPEVTFLYGSCFSFSASQPYSLMGNTIRQLCHINDDDDDLTLRHKFNQTIENLMGEKSVREDGSYSELAVLIGLAMGLNLPNRLIDNLEPPLRSRLATDAISDFLLNKSAEQPLVLVLDDLHWIDTSSLDVLDRIVQKVAAGEKKALPVLLLLVHRPTFEHNWPLDYHHCSQVIEPGRLTDAQLATLAWQLLGKLAGIEYSATEIGAPLPPPLLSELARADGNPFFAEEILKSLWNSHQLYFVKADPELGERGGWKATDNAERFVLPDTLQEILLARIDGLPGASKRVLQVGAVIGQHFEHRLLLSVEDLRQRSQQVDSALDELHQESFIYTERAAPDPAYAFRQALTQEVAYQNLLTAERKVYHEQIAAAIERIYSSHLEDADILTALARHYQNTDNQAKAILYLTRAGRGLQNIYQNETALRSFYEARTRLNLLTDSEENFKQTYTVEIHRSIGEVLALRAEYAPALEAYRVALAACEDAASRVDLWSSIIEVLARLGEFEQATAANEQAQIEYAVYDATTRADPHFCQMYARLLARSGWAAYQQSKYSEAIVTFKTALALLEKLSLDNRTVQVDTGTVYGNLGSVYLDTGQVEEAAHCFQQAIVLQEQASNLAKVARANINLAIIYTIQGEWRKAEQYFKLARDNAERVGDVEALATSVGNLGQIYERQGRLGAAIRSYAEANRSFGLSANLLLQAVNQLNMGYVLLQQGKTSEALTLFESSNRTAITLNVGWLLAYGYVYLGLATQNLQEAREWLYKGYQQAQESGNPEVLAVSCLYLAEFLLENSPDATVPVYLDEAAPLIKQLGDPTLQGRLERLQGRLATQQQQLALAISTLQNSLDIFAELRAYLEMSYTKFYLAEALLAQAERHQTAALALTFNNIKPSGLSLFGSVETVTSLPSTDYERAQVLLQQAVETFRACEANLILPKALALLEKYSPARAA